MKLLAPSLLLVLGACAAPYKLAPDVPAAELTFSTSEHVDAYICEFEKHKLSKLGVSARSTSAGGQFLSGLTFGLSDSKKPVAPLVRQIQAGSRVRIIGSSGAMKSMGAATTLTKCSYGFDVVPETGARYKAEYSYDLEAGQCHMSLLKLDMDKQDWIPVPPLADSPECKLQN